MIYTERGRDFRPSLLHCPNRYLCWPLRSSALYLLRR